MEAIKYQKNHANLFDNDQYLAAAQVRISPDLKIVKDEILSPPIIKYENGIEKTIANRKWDPKDCQFVKPIVISCLAI
uniref:Uncharacterized protein n=1 Tax=Panagrolaimus davidi TaxID=227884 RepID=A0A914PXA6_9BILA